MKRLQYDWHTESSYFPNASEAVTLWYPWLHSVNQENGTMMIAPGSNKYSLNATRIKEIGSLTQMKISSEDMSKFSQLHTCLDVGDAILFSYRLAHKSGNNLSNIPRTTIIARYTDFKGKWDSGWN